MTDHESTHNGPGGIAGFIERQHPSILSDWEHMVRLQLQAGLPRPVLINHMPELLISIAQAAEQIYRGGSRKPQEKATMMHAIQRLEAGLDLDQVAAEFMLLRSSVLEHWRKDGPAQEQQQAGMRALNQAIDQAIITSIRYYTQARDRTLLALDRVSAAALESRSLDDFLERLLQLTQQTMPAVDGMVVLLLDDDVLRVHAATGMNGKLAELASRVGEGFVGGVAARRQPQLFSGDVEDQEFWEALQRRQGFQAIYGFPLVHGEELVGVVVVASRSAADFSKQDQLLFTTLASRITAAIVQHVLHSALERRAEQQAAVAELGVFGLLNGNPQRIKERALELVAEVLRTDAIAIEQLDSQGNLATFLHRGEWPFASPRPVMPGSQAELTLKSQQPVVVKDYLDEARFSFPASVREHGLRSGITILVQAPDEVTGRPYGIVGAYSRNQRGFNAQDALFLQAVGSIIARAVLQRRSTEALAIGAGRLQAILDNSPAAIYLKDPEGRYILVNRSYEKETGLAGDAVVGKLDSELFAKEGVGTLHRNDMQAIEQGQPVEAEEAFVLAGRLRIWHSIKFPLLDTKGRVYAICGISTDITERRRSEMALRESEERLQLATSAADLGSFDWDLTTATVGWSQKIREMFRLPDTIELSQTVWLSLIHPEDRVRVLELFNTAQLPGSDGVYRAEYRVLPADGSPERWISAHGRILFDERNQPRRFIGIARDITVSKHADLERERLLGELEQAVRFREDMLAIVSHDLRNPLGAIKLGSAQLVRQALNSDSDDRVLRQLDIIQRASNRMERLISSLLDMASIRAGRLSMELSPCDAVSLLEEALDFHASAAAEKAIVLEQQIELTDSCIQCDHHRMQQVFSNLLGNAISYCSTGNRVQVRAQQAEKCIHFVIADNGPGIDPEKLAHIFEPYWSEGHGHGRSTGLGLFITKGIVEAHGGRLWVESTLGDGSAFHFTIPLRKH